jgi:PleD family two-component response regulator/EAL domain-containing protein (putative c-di-GMP-specific phosphodiesterase class I)
MIKTNSISAQQDEYRQAFLRHLPKRIEAVEQRIQRFRRDGWEANGMALLNDDVQRLAGASGRYDLIEPSQHLLTLEQMLGDHIARKSLPDAHHSERMLALMAAVTASLAVRPDSQQNSAHSEVAPEAYWRRWVPDAPAASAMPPPNQAPTAPAAAAKNETAKATATSATTARRIYHLSDGNALAFELGQRLESDGYEVEPVETVEELSELLMSLSPQLVLVDSSRMPDLTAVGTARRDTQQRSHNQQRIQLVAMASQDNLQSRLDARRAGVDVLLFPPFNASEVLRQLQALLAPMAEEKVRVLIVEDDRAQALFAQSVLTNAGMLAQVEQDPMHVLEALEALHPDLVLMDLHMPHANGVELTGLIREHPAFMRTPIVFLSGENDPDARFEAINAGGDDFLSKPIRPKHLIAAVQNRVRRMRTLDKQVAPLGARDEATGLYRRAFVLDRVNDALGTSMDQRGADQDSAVGGALFLEIDGAAALRDRLGLAALEQLMVAAGHTVAAALGEQHVGARINDNAFLVLAVDLDDNALDALAQRLRDQILQSAFEAGGKPMRLRASVGICALRYGFGDASALLNTAERACREARINDQGVKRYEPPKAAEVNHEAALIEQLREAISSDGFGLIYQPIVAVQGGQGAQYQTLLRMRDASGRLLPAAEILPLAERARLMLDIDRWVLTRAMSVVRQQRESGRSVRLFIPQAMTSFAAKEQGGWLKAELAANELSGSALVLECRLEDALLNPPALATFGNAMQADGVRLCLGQFEQSTDATRLIEHISFGFIKLAPKYVAADVPQTVRDELRSMIDHAHRLGIQVIGHRVEDAQTAATLWMSGIDYIQGNLVQSAAGALDFDFNVAVL